MSAMNLEPLLEEGVIAISTVAFGAFFAILNLVDSKLSNVLNKFLFAGPLSFLIFIYMATTDFYKVDWWFLLMFSLCIFVILLLVVLFTFYVQKGTIFELLENVAGGTISNGVIFGIPFTAAAFGTQYIPYVLIAGLIEIGIQIVGCVVLLSICKAKENEEERNEDIELNAVASVGDDAVEVEAMKEAPPLPSPGRVAGMYVLKTPLIWAFVIGMTWGAIGVPVPSLLSRIVTPLSRAAVPSLLFVIGMFSVNSLKDAYHERKISGDKKVAFVSWTKVVSLFFMKIIGLPIIALPICLAFSDPISIRIALLILACPAASTSFVVASQLKDPKSGRIMAILVIVSSIVGVFAIAGMFMFLDAVGLWLI